MRVILDTNVWLSGIFWGGKPGLIVDRIIRSGRLKPVFSEATLGELEEKVKKFYPELITINLLKVGEMVILKPSKKITVRDVKDQMWVDLCKMVKVDYLITGDKDLLILKKINGTMVITPNEFLMRTQI